LPIKRAWALCSVPSVAQTLRARSYMPSTRNIRRNNRIENIGPPASPDVYMYPPIGGRLKRKPNKKLYTFVILEATSQTLFVRPCPFPISLFGSSHIRQKLKVGALAITRMSSEPGSADNRRVEWKSTISFGHALICPVQYK
jgi:hypothetical protein